MFTTADLPTTMQADYTRPHDCGHTDCGHNAPVAPVQTGVPSGR